MRQTIYNFLHSPARLLGFFLRNRSDSGPAFAHANYECEVISLAARMQRVAAAVVGPILIRVYFCSQSEANASNAQCISSREIRSWDRSYEQQKPVVRCAWAAAACRRRVSVSDAEFGSRNTSAAAERKSKSESKAN